MKCTDLLIQEHKIILRAMDVLDHMATRVENSQPVAPEDVETLLRFLRGFADDHHQAQEESALFPELMRTSAWHEDPLRHMVFEHDQERSLVDGLEDALQIKDSAVAPEHQFLRPHAVETAVRAERAPAERVAEIVDPGGVAHVVAGQQR